MYQRMLALLRGSAALVLLVSMGARAQPPMATLTGQVVEAGSFLPVPGASIMLLPGNVSLTAASDSAGRFRLPGIPVGHYALRVAALGHDTLEVPELWLRAGKQADMRLELSASAQQLGAVMVSAMAREQPVRLGVRTFTVEQGLRWPATFHDPGRLVTAMPGVANMNDQANHLSIRGNSPNANAYLLEGLEIVSPNHTGNGGTTTDLPVLSGGGVNLLSAQMLGPSQLLTGVLPMDHGNALGGILDMRLRKGNMHRQEWTAQAGLLGIDLSTEGPLGQSGRSSYLVNYRYSTVGLLGAMGVDLGDEQINFQDLAFHVSLPVGKRGEASLFGMGGNSRNLFEAVLDTLEWTYDKDGRNIDYASAMGAAGGVLRIPAGERSSLTAAFAISAIEQHRTENWLRPDYSLGRHFEARLEERKHSGSLKLEGAVGARIRYAIGGSALERRIAASHQETISGWLLRPWASLQWSVTDRLRAQLGGGLSMFTFTGEAVAEPRGALQWRMRRGRALALNAGIRTQLPPWQLFDPGTQVWVQQPIGLARSTDLVLGYHHPFTERLVLHAETYWQHLSHVPVSAPGAFLSSSSGFSLVNSWDAPVPIPLAPTGTATNIGAELSLDHRFASSFFYQANISVFDSRYTDAQGQEATSRWGQGFTSNLLAGKEFKRTKEDRVRTWGISGRVSAMGGLRDRPIELRLSAATGTTVHISDTWSEQLAPFFRVDLRLYRKMDREGRTGMWSIDLQNATNTRNEAFRYYDSRMGEVVTKHQLGIIPNLSYRIEF